MKRIPVGIITLILFCINLQLFYPTSRHTPSGAYTPGDLINQLAHLRSELEGGAAADMQWIFPEGFCFMNAIYGLTWYEVGMKAPSPSALRSQAIAEATWALRELESDDARRTFDRSLSPPYGIFYQGWTNLLRMSICELREPGSLEQSAQSSLKEQCDTIAIAFNNSTSPFLPTYHGQAWPADATTAIASLAIYDRIFGPTYEALIQRWISKVTSRLDPATGLIPHSVDPISGRSIEGARGSSQVLLLRLMSHIDPSFARKQFQVFKQYFPTYWLGMPVVREYPYGVSGPGDVDSGPVIFGVGATASIVGLGTYYTFNESERAQQLEQSIEALGFSMTIDERKCYIFGALPMGDLFLAWSKAANVAPLSASGESGEDPASMWRLPWQILFIGWLILLGIIKYRRGKSRVLKRNTV